LGLRLAIPKLLGRGAVSYTKFFESERECLAQEERKKNEKQLLMGLGAGYNANGSC